MIFFGIFLEKVGEKVLSRGVLMVAWKMVRKMAQKMGKKMVKIWWKFLEKFPLKRGVIFRVKTSLKILYKISFSSSWWWDDLHHLIYHAVVRYPHGCVSTVSVIINTHWCWECSTLSTGGAQLAPYGEWALRWRDWSPYAYGTESRDGVWAARRKAWWKFFNLNHVFLMWRLSTLTVPASAPMHVGDRSTWLNSEALSRDKDLFFEKKKIRLF
jgi:hypothetical protein